MVSTRSQSRSEPSTGSVEKSSEQKKEPRRPRSRSTRHGAAPGREPRLASEEVSTHEEGEADVDISYDGSSFNADAEMILERSVLAQLVPRTPPQAREPSVKDPTIAVGDKSLTTVSDASQKKQTSSNDILSSSAAPLSGENVPSSSADFSMFSEDKTPVFLRRDAAVSQLCREVIFDCYREQSTTEFGPNISNQHLVPQRRGGGLPPLGPVHLLEIGTHFDSDQLWEELELRNKPMLSHIQRRLRRVSFSHIAAAKQRLNNKNAERREEHREENEDVGEGITDVRSAPSSSVLAEVSKRQMSDTPEPVMKDRERAGAEKGTSKRKVTFAPTVSDGVVETLSADKGASNLASLDDGFFSLGDMEMFADEAEQLAVAGKLVESDDEDNGDIQADDESDDDSAGVIQHSAPTKTTAEHSDRLRYEDFFDPPARLSTLQLGDKLDQTSQLLEGNNIDDFADEETVDTPLSASRSRTRQLIDAIEEENIGKKQWQLRGEVSGHARPKGSLLGADMDHDSTSGPGLPDGVERNEMIEDVIRQRIVDGLFDDVIRSFHETTIAHDKKILPEVSQEKSSEGLADLYAREFVKEKERTKDSEKSREVTKEAEVETADQKEANMLFDKLSSKLDALSGLRFAPSSDNASSEMTVQGNVSAIASEDAIPEGVSDASMLTPKETYSVDRKTLVGGREVTKIERKAAHAKVKRKKKAVNAKNRAAELMQHAHPALLEKRRAEEAFLRKGKKIKIAAPQDRNDEVEDPSSSHGKSGIDLRQQFTRDEGRSASSLML